jgi:uncharacterized protein involved in exopolysaccharide biosynthesis
MIQPQAITPTIIQVVPPPSAQVGVVDVIVGSFGLTGMLILGSLVLGGLLGGALIAFRHRREARSEDGTNSDQTRLDLSSPSR